VPVVRVARRRPQGPGAELPTFDFAGTVAATNAAWEHELSAVAVQGGTDEAKRNFYTALYTSCRPGDVSAT